jgi:hypothetical protein
LALPTLRFADLDLGPISNHSQQVDKTIPIEAGNSIKQIEVGTHSQWQLSLVRGQIATSFTLHLRSNGILAARKVDDDIVLTPISAEGKKLPAKLLKISGEIMVDVVPSSKALYFGLRPCGTVGQDAIMLRSLTNTPFTVKHVFKTAIGLEVVDQTQANNKEILVYTVRMPFGEVGEHQESITFSISQPDGREFDIVVPVRYRGYSEAPN